MIILYDWKLVVLSVAVAVLGAHAGFTILAAKESLRQVPYKVRLAGGAVTIGAGVWAMHFIGMLALHVPADINYLVLPTLISALVGVVLTGLGLYAATSGRLARYGCGVGAVLSGLGVSSMHYIGMEAVRAGCQLSYAPVGVLASVAISIGVAWLAFRFITSGAHSARKTACAALLLGMAIASMHYVAMLGTQFAFVEGVVAFERPALNDTYLSVVVAILTFLLIDVFLLMALPGERIIGTYRRSRAASDAKAAVWEAASPSLRWRSRSVLAGAPMASHRDRAGEGAMFGWSMSSEPVTRFSSPFTVSRLSSVFDWRDAGDYAPPAPACETEVSGDVDVTPTEPLRADEAGETPNASIPLTNKGRVTFVNTTDVLFASADGRYTCIGFLNGSGRFEQQFCDRSISTLCETLEAFGFSRVHRSHLVNMKHIAGHQRRGDAGEVVFACAEAPRKPVSRSQYAKICREIERVKGAV